MAKMKPAAQDRPKSVDEHIRQAHLEQRFKDWLQASRQHMTAIVVAIAIVILVVGVIWLWQERQTTHLKNAYAAYDQAETVEDYKTVAENYAGTEVAAKAAFAAAQKMYAEEQYADAAQEFAAFLNTYPKSDLKLAARFGRAYALEAAARTDEAQTLFAELGDSDIGNPGRRAEAWLGAGRCAETQGLTEQARTYYENALSQETERVFNEQAQEALTLLDLKAHEKTAAAEDEE